MNCLRLIWQMGTALFRQDLTCYLLQLKAIVIMRFRITLTTEQTVVNFESQEWCIKQMSLSNLSEYTHFRNKGWLCIYRYLVCHRANTQRDFECRIHALGILQLSSVMSIMEENIRLWDWKIGGNPRILVKIVYKYFTW